MAARRPRGKDVPDAKVLKMLKASRILKPDVTLDQLMEISARLNIPGSAARGFIFRHFLYRPC
jgi:hypothetical protein